MDQITVTIPAIDETVMATIDRLTTQASASEVEALKEIRAKYARLGRQNGYVRIAHYGVQNTNWNVSNDVYYERDGRKARALLTFDNFGDRNTDQNSGIYEGDKLYLLESGEWLRIERAGYWSRWQGSPDAWGCGVSADSDDDRDTGGSVKILTDDQVAAEYPLEGILDQLGKSLRTLAEKLPQRMAKLQQRVSLAAQLMEALKA